mmetsp:Transcript_26871/g.59432  ORF Transcript_26871/g.59432 Transcript_26871/m.59432 type:complete len:215 (-) Transcript_26871:667-1311(-)
MVRWGGDPKTCRAGGGTATIGWRRGARDPLREPPLHTDGVQVLIKGTVQLRLLADAQQGTFAPLPRSHCRRQHPGRLSGRCLLLISSGILLVLADRSSTRGHLQKRPQLRCAHDFAVKASSLRPKNDYHVARADSPFARINTDTNNSPRDPSLSRLGKDIKPVTASEAFGPCWHVVGQCKIALHPQGGRPNERRDHRRYNHLHHRRLRSPPVGD